MKKTLILIPLVVLSVLVWRFAPWKQAISEAPSADLFHLSSENKVYYQLDTSFSLVPNAHFAKKATTVVALIVNRHYKKQALNDSISANTFDNYIEDIDEAKLYFLQSDIDDFKKYRLNLDDELRQESNNLNVPYYIYNIYLKRVLERLERNKALLQENYDFSTDEYYETDRKKVAYPKNQEEADKEWRKVLKNSFLEGKLSGETAKQTAEKLTKRYETFKKNLLKTTAEDVFQSYMNALALAYDPHTNYFSPISASNFNMSMNRSMEGIGATLTTENDYITIADVRPGGPAFKSKKLFKKDRIVAVAQGDGGEMVDVVGWRVDEAVQIIRGKKGTVVRLKILPASEGANAKPTEVRMVREKITFEEQSATKQIIEIPKGNKVQKVGVISIPAFYINFEEYREGKPDYKSTTNDVKKLIGELQQENIEALIIDLRYNGGGSLKEAIDLTSLFIKSGAVVQVKDANGRISVGETDDFKQIYQGPLLVMTNRFSASASEIFSGAIQDYKRGLIVGENTYGKGTVQNVMDLSKYLVSESNDGNVGQLNLTVSKYYRASGSSVQNKGVTPDIILPSAFDDKEFSEAGYKTSLPWDEIEPARAFKPNNEINSKQIKHLQNDFQKRLKNDDDLKKLLAEVEKMRKRRKETRISLNETKRKAEKDEAKKELSPKIEDDDENDTKKKVVENFKDLKDLYLKNAIVIALDLAKL
ncbi:MAG: carboxy terminal-processing peptidase [Thermonemataceae bacterium]|nr:carboxy terminal-processing peptidase [Thermonemataceae bacterium]